MISFLLVLMFEFAVALDCSKLLDPTFKCFFGVYSFLSSNLLLELLRLLRPPMSFRPLFVASIQIRTCPDSSLNACACLVPAWVAAQRPSQAFQDLKDQLLLDRLTAPAFILGCAVQPVSPASCSRAAARKTRRRPVVSRHGQRSA